MALISVRWRHTDAPTAGHRGRRSGRAAGDRYAGELVRRAAGLARRWRATPANPRARCAVVRRCCRRRRLPAWWRRSASCSPYGLARVADRQTAIAVWLLGVPWCLTSLGWLLSREALVVLWLVPLPWVWFGLWPLTRVPPALLHHARWARRADLKQLRAKPSSDGLPPDEGLVLGRHQRDWLIVRSQPQQRELGGLLVVGRPRSGKGLLAVSQILGAWQQHSLVCTDLKGELHAATAGWRARTGKVIVLDPTGVGHRFDPLAGRDTEDDLYRAAQDILHVDGEGDGQAFTERAASMLAAIFVAAKREEIPACRMLAS